MKLFAKILLFQIPIGLIILGGYIADEKIQPSASSPLGGMTTLIWPVTLGISAIFELVCLPFAFLCDLPQTDKLANNQANLIPTFLDNRTALGSRYYLGLQVWALTLTFLATLLIIAVLTLIFLVARNAGDPELAAYLAAGAGAGALLLCVMLLLTIQQALKRGGSILTRLYSMENSYAIMALLNPSHPLFQPPPLPPPPPPPAPAVAAAAAAPVPPAPAVPAPIAPAAVPAPVHAIRPAHRGP